MEVLALLVGLMNTVLIMILFLVTNKIVRAFNEEEIDRKAAWTKAIEMKKALAIAKDEEKSEE